MANKKIYVIPTYQCNLNCPHCEISKFDNEHDANRFYETLNLQDDRSCILFGGEPLLLGNCEIERLLKTHKFNSISTNLLLLNDDLIRLFNLYDISIATSWNPNRFNELQYSKWLNNLKIALDNGIYVTLLITVDYDLLNYSHLANIFNDIDSILDNNIQYFNGVRFELYVPATQDLVNKTDIFMCNMLDNWSWKFNFINKSTYKNGNLSNRCGNTWTLKPNGQLEHVCPHNVKYDIMHECLSCKYIKVCNPCKVQKVCTLLKSFFEKVNSYGNG